MPSRAGIITLILTLLAAGCAAQRAGVRGGGGLESGPALAPMPDDSAVITIRLLESDPLADGAPRLRSRLFAWMLTSERLHDFDGSTAPIDELETSDNRCDGELMMQFLFGAAAWRLGTDSIDIVAQQAAGIRSMITAYRNMVQVDASLRDPFLDRLDDLRRLGELRHYIERKHRTE